MNKKNVEKKNLPPRCADVTRGKRQEESLRASEEFNRTVLASLTDNIAILDKQGRIIAANEAWSAFGLRNGLASLESIGPGSDYLEVCRQAAQAGDDLAQQALDGVQSVLAPERLAFELEYPCNSPSESRWFLLRAVPMQGPEGGAIVSHTDISRRKEAEIELRKVLEELQESEEHFRHLFEYSMEGVAVYEILYDDHGKVVDWILVKANPMTADYLPSPLEQAIGRRATELFGTEYMREYFRICQEVLESGQGRRFETFFPPTGTHHLAWVYAIGKSYYVTGSVDITERKRMEIELQDALTKLESMRERLELENVYLRNLALAESGHAIIIGGSMPVRRMLGLARKVAPTDSPVLISGETGTGKELLAQAIHDLSPRGKKMIIKVNCATLPALLIESELFGREKGAYTGALTRELSRFELAHGSTIFLDEIGELPLEVQGKLLRVLQEGQFERLGSPHTHTVDVRVIAATNRDLAGMVQTGRFRADLFYRLHVFPIEVPALRERREDIPLLAWRFVNEFSQKMGKTIDSIPRRSMELLQQYSWPGNVRELRNVVERAMILSGSPTLKIEIPLSGLPENAPPETLAEVERQQILDVLNRTGWRVAGSGGAAEILGLKRTTLEARMKKWEIKRPPK